jgi:hypothetical protein
LQCSWKAGEEVELGEGGGGWENCDGKKTVLCKGIVQGVQYIDNLYLLFTVFIYLYNIDDVAAVVFSKMDRDGDHALSFQEFRLHMKHKINKKVEQ